MENTVGIHLPYSRLKCQCLSEISGINYVFLCLVHHMQAVFAVPPVTLLNLFTRLHLKSAQTQLSCLFYFLAVSHYDLLHALTSSSTGHPLTIVISRV